MRPTAALKYIAALIAVKLLWDLLKPHLRYRLTRLQKFVLRNDSGIEVHISPLGAIIQRLLVPDRQAIRTTCLFCVDLA